MFTAAIAQEKAIKFFNHNEFGYHFGIYNYEIITGANESGGKNVNVVLLNQTGFSIRSTNGITIKEHLVFGIGIGLENYYVKERPLENFSFMPIFFNTMYFFNKKDMSGFFAGISFGNGIRINSPSERGGAVLSPSIGYKFNIKKLPFSASLLYKQQNIKGEKDESYIKKPQIRSYGVSIGLFL